MVRDILEEYIYNQVKKRSFPEIKEECLSKGYTSLQIDMAIDRVIKQRPKKKIFFWIGLIIVFALFFGVLYFYFNYLSNPFLGKQDIVPPNDLSAEMLSFQNRSSGVINYSGNSSLLQNTTSPTANASMMNATQLLEELVSNLYLSRLLNDLGTWKLHNSPSGSPAIITINIVDLGKTYSFNCQAGTIPRRIDSTANSDVDINIDFSYLVSLIREGDNHERVETIRDLLDEAKIEFVVKSDLNTLWLKGYLGLLQELGISFEDLGLSPIEQTGINGKYFSIILILFLILVLVIIWVYLKKRKN